MHVVTLAFAVLGCTLVLYLVVGAVNDLVWRARTRRFQTAAALLGRVMFGTEAEAEAAVGPLTHMPRSLLIRSLQSLAADVAGESRDRLNRLVAAVGLRATVARRAASGRSWRRRVQAAQLSQLLPPGDPVRRQLLRDRHPVVRARALEGMEADEVAEDIKIILALLRDPTPVVRAAAQRAVLAADGRVVPYVIAELNDPAQGVISPLLAVAASLPDPRLVPAIGAHAVSADSARRCLVAEALGALRSPHAAPILSGLLGDEEPRVRAAAVTAVGHTGATDLAGRAGDLLADGSWDVRRAAAQALGALGPPGWMVLRAALRSPRPEAADMARQMLDHVATARWGAESLSPEQFAAYGRHLALAPVAR